MSKKICLFVLPLMALSLGVTAHADEYPACKERCVTDNAECLKLIQPAEPDAKEKLEKSCQIEADACNADCEEIRSIAGIIRKIME